MKFELVHPFWKDYPDAHHLCEGSKKGNFKWNTWFNRVKRIGDDIADGIVNVNYNCPQSIREKGLRETSWHFKGAAFEAWGESYIKICGNDDRISIYDYKPTLENDFGVDGVGKGWNGKIATVQFKFRSEPGVLRGRKDHLNNFVNASLRQYEVDPADDNNMIIFTTAQEVHYEELVMKWRGKVKYIAPDRSWGCFSGVWSPKQQPTRKVSLTALTDDNHGFWESLLESIG
jgi:hypothetical protein